MLKKAGRMCARCFVLIVLLAAGSHAFLHRSGKNIVDSQGKTVILRGFGPGEWLNIESYFLELPGEDVGTPSNPTYSHTATRNKLGQLMGTANADTFYARWTRNIITETDVAQYAGWGINSLRISMNYHWLSSADGVYIQSGFAMLDSIVAWGARYGVYIILAMHAAPGGQNREQMGDVADGNARLWTDSATYQPWTIHLWQYIASRYSQEQWVGGFDYFDEPILNSNSADPDDAQVSQNTRLLAFYKRLTAAVRSVDGNHALFVESAVGWSSDFTNLTPFDSNMAWDFHDYNFDNASVNSYSDYYTLRNTTGFPLWNGEFGENNNTWAQNTKNQCETNTIGWNWWTTKKLGDNTQAYTIATPANFSQIINAFNGSSSLTQAQAVTIMFALADNAATAKCTKNCGVVNALGLNCNAAPAQPLTTSAAGEEGKIGPARAQNSLCLRSFTGASGVKLAFFLPFAAPAEAALYTTGGALVKTAVYPALTAGAHTADLDRGNAVSRGVYFCVLSCGRMNGSATTAVVVR
jgi:endoglucanase